MHYAFVSGLFPELEERRC